MVLTNFSSLVEDFLNKQGMMAYNFLCAAKNYDDAVFYVDNEKNIGCVAMIVEDSRIFICDNTNSFAEEFFDTVLTPLKEYTFCGVAENILRLKERFQNSWENACDCYCCEENSKTLSGDLIDLKNKLGAKVELSSLNINNAQEVDYYYTYKDETSFERIVEEIANRPSSALIVNGELAAWNVVHRDGSMGAMFTKEKFRKLGLAEVVTKDLISKQKQAKKVPYVQIVTDNTASKKLAAKCGLEFFGRVYWLGGIKK